MKKNTWENDAFLPNQFAHLFQLIDLAHTVLSGKGVAGEKEIFLRDAEIFMKEGPEFFEKEFERIRSWAGDGIYPENGEKKDA